MKTANGQQKQHLNKPDRIINILTIGLLFCTLTTWGQVQMPQTPQPFHFQPINPTQSQPNNSKPNGLEQYEKDRQRQLEQQKHLQEIYRDIEEFNRPTVSYDLPSCTSLEGAEAYRSAFSEISKMADGQKTFSVKEANFLVENAYFNNRANYQEFDKVIQQIGQFINWKMDDVGYPSDQPILLRWI